MKYGNLYRKIKRHLSRKIVYYALHCGCTPRADKKTAGHRPGGISLNFNLVVVTFIYIDLLDMKDRSE